MCSRVCSPVFVIYVCPRCRVCNGSRASRRAWSPLSEILVQLRFRDRSEVKPRSRVMSVACVISRFRDRSDVRPPNACSALEHMVLLRTSRDISDVMRDRGVRFVMSLLPRSRVSIDVSPAAKVASPAFVTSLRIPRIRPPPLRLRWRSPVKLDRLLQVPSVHIPSERTT